MEHARLRRGKLHTTDQTTGDRKDIGTSSTTSSKVWHTPTGGTVSEIYHPCADTAAVPPHRTMPSDIGG